MAVFTYLPFVAAALGALVAIASLVRKTPSLATWAFFGGMLLLALDATCTGLGLRAAQAAGVERWLARGVIVKSALPAVWLTFSLAYSRGNASEFLARWRIPLAVIGLLCVGLAVGFHDRLIEVAAMDPPAAGWWLRSGPVAKALNAGLLVSFALVLSNLEQTFRSAVGTQRWRIKFVILGLAVVFGVQIYVRSQAILFSVHDAALLGVEASALLVGCLLLGVAYARTGLAEIDVYPSLTVLRSSITAVLLGVYLFIVGVLAEVARAFGGAETFQFQALIVLLGLVGLGVLLLSDRLRLRVHQLAVRHFRPPRHDAARAWTECSRRLGSVKDQAGLVAAAARLVSETFDVLSVTVWLLDPAGERLVFAASTASTAAPAHAAGDAGHVAASPAVTAALREREAAFDCETLAGEWADEWRRLNPSLFPNGGNRWCVPLGAGAGCLGAIVLADRVQGVPYTLEDRELLACIADQVTSVLLNLRLGGELAQARELEAFRTMSAFFVHDLKNTAASLKLMLQNLPVHFDDPGFREDALRSMGNTAWRIDEMIQRLSALRQRPEPRRERADLNQLVADALARLPAIDGIDLVQDLRPLPPVLVDPDQVRSVVTNLVVNAREAVSGAGRVEVRTAATGADGPAGAARVVLSVSDNGRGMTPSFVRDSLFRPFQSTKSRGLGIGMFQARMIVEAHGGVIQVASEAGVGTTFRISLPAGDEG